jgi:hypothetical protein
MKKKIIPILLIGVLVLSGLGAGAILKPKSSSQNTIDEWYYYPQLQNYAPQGMPDFDQKQNNWKDPVYDGWTFCGAVSVSNIFWYLDSYYSDSIGVPGDGYDIFPIVLDYHAFLHFFIKKTSKFSWFFQRYSPHYQLLLFLY